MAKTTGSRQGDHFADARKYAGKNTCESVGDGRGSDMGIKSIRPFVVTPNGRTFNEQWGRYDANTSTGHRPPSGKKK